MNKDKKNVLVAGANGTTGKMIVDFLQKSDQYNPIAMVRKEDQKQRFEKDNVITVLGDLEKNLDQAFAKDVDKVIFAAGSKGKNVIGVDQDGAKRFADASKKAGVKKFVMLSSMGADDPTKGGELKEYLKAKQNADEHLKSMNLDYVIVRPGHLTNDKGVGKIELSPALIKSGSISREDVAKTLVEVLDDGVMNNQTFEIIEGEKTIHDAVRTNDIN